MDLTDKRNFLSNIYVPVTEKSMRTGIYVISSGHAKCGTIHENPELFRGIHLWPEGRTLNCFSIVYIASGTMLLYPDPALSKTVNVTAGKMILTVPDVRYRYHASPSSGVEELWIKFDGFYARTLQKNLILPAKTSVYSAVSNNETMKGYFTEIHKLSHHEMNSSVQYKLVPIFLKIMLWILFDNDKKSFPLVEKAIKYMYERIYDRYDIHEFVKRHGISVRNFRRIFKNATGNSPRDYFLTLKLNKARELLDAGCSVKETAYKLNFEDPYYFSRIFRKKTGIPPSYWKGKM